ncbi:MAG: hypothetical protein OEX19_14240 [Gammaproteobacteria bacterium]|nr:hypothetical protein [Gammaproteobacteria bacterium]
MEVDRISLSKEYAEKTNDELLSLHQAGILTDLAYDILEEELQSRDVTTPERPETIASPVDNTMNPGAKMFIVSLFIGGGSAITVNENYIVGMLLTSIGVALMTILR